MSKINSFLPLQLFGSGQLLCLSSDCQTGLILQQPHYADFVGSGGAVGGIFDTQSVSVYTLGDVQFLVPATYQERQQAYRNRLSYMNSLHKITFVRSPIHRAYLLVRQLSIWLGVEEAAAIPYDLMGQLVAVLPATIQIGWQQYLQDHYTETVELVRRPAFSSLSTGT